MNITLIIPDNYYDEPESFVECVRKLPSFKKRLGHKLATASLFDLTNTKSNAVINGNLLDENAIMALEENNFIVFQESIENGANINLFYELNGIYADELFFNTFNKNYLKFFNFYYKKIKNDENYFALISLVDKALDRSVDTYFFANDLGKKRFNRFINDYIKNGFPITNTLYEHIKYEIDDDMVLKNSILKFKKRYESASDEKKLVLNKIIKSNK